MDQQHRPTPVQQARALAPKISAAADEIERTQQFPAPLMDAVHAARLFHLFLPRSLGGEEVHPAAYLDAVVAVAAADGSLGWNMFVANSSCLIAPYVSEACAQAIYADPKAVIAWGPPNACRLKAVDGGYRVTGEWPFASGSAQATWMGAHGHVEEADGVLRLNEQGAPLIRTVLFPAHQATFLGDWNPLGLRGTASRSYRVEDVFVAEAYSGTREAPDARQEPGPLYAFTMQGLYAVGVAGVALGLATAMLDEFRILAAKKTPRGLSRLAEDQMTQADFARSGAKLGASHAYIVAIVSDIYERANSPGAIGMEDRAKVRLAASHAIQSAIDVADWVYRAAGVSAIFPGSAFERRFRDMHTLSQQIQARPTHFRAVGQVLLGDAPAVFY